MSGLVRSVTFGASSSDHTFDAAGSRIPNTARNSYFKEPEIAVERIAVGVRS